MAMRTLPASYEVVDGEIQPRHMTGQYCECDECTGEDRDYCPCCLHDPCCCQSVIDQGAGHAD